MGRKPNPIIAAHYIRGNKHGQTTNRYAQTCSHCGLHFPTGRPETLLTHLASCPMLDAAERAAIINRMYNTFPVVEAAVNNSISYHQHQASHQSVGHDNDFDITGLNVLAGAAENAEDLAIDPQIAGRESTPQTTSAGGPPLPFYDHQYGNSYHNPTSSNPWSFQFPTTQGPPSPFSDLPGVSSPDTSFTTAGLPVTHWSFAPVITAPIPYTTHLDQNASISFADQHGNELLENEQGSSIFPTDISIKHRARKSREPYTEPKRARVAEMRQVGACIRCSRLRKNCDPQRPCEVCRKTTAKTWIGGCTSLNKGQEFNVWFEPHLSKLYQHAMQASAGEYRIDDDTICDGNLELKFFGREGPHVTFEFIEARSMNDHDDNQNECGPKAQIHVISGREDITQKIHQHVLDHQELLLDVIDNPATCATVRIAQGLSSPPDDDTDQVRGTGKQTDKRLRSILELWLFVTIITHEKLTREWSLSANSNDSIVSKSICISECQKTLSDQIDTILDKYLQSTQEELRRFDANILNQNYKYLFNLVVGMFLILDAVERYCCYLRRRKCLSVDQTTMVEQARTLAHKYTYCVHNIQMMPKLVSNEDQVLVAEDKNGKIDYEMQRLWIAELNMSESDIKEYLGDENHDEWLVPTGRLWAKLFIGLKPEG